ADRRLAEPVPIIVRTTEVEVCIVLPARGIAVARQEQDDLVFRQRAPAEDIQLRQDSTAAHLIRAQNGDLGVLIQLLALLSPEGPNGFRILVGKEQVP